MEELAKIVILLVLLGSVIAYLQGGWARVGTFWRMKLVGGSA